MALATTLALLCSAAPRIAAQAAAGADAGDMTVLLDKLADRADRYKRYALGFTCEESLVRSHYDAEKGAFKRRDREVYDYLLTTEEDSGDLKEVRDIVEENGKKVRRNERKLSLDIPPSYAWSQIFSRTNRARFLFKPAGKIVRGYRLLILIDFAGTGAEPGTSAIAGWSGQVSVDSETLNLYSLDAEPTGQQARIEAEQLKYQRAFAIMGVPLASRPKSRSLSVNFAFENEGLTYPAEATVTKSVYVRSGELGLDEKTILRYRDYRFFKVGTQQSQSHDKPTPAQPGDANAPTPGSGGGPSADPNGSPPPPLSGGGGRGSR